MKLEPLNFKFEGRELSVCANCEPDRWVVFVLEGSNPVANCFYTVTHNDVIVARMKGFDSNLVNGLMEHARLDIENRIVPLN